MLVLSRKTGESLVIGGRIVVTVVRVEGEAVRLGIAAPADVPVHRQEIYDEIQRNNQQALTKHRPKVPRLARKNDLQAHMQQSAAAPPQGVGSPTPKLSTAR
jgi:carbon storage regulator